MVDLQIIENMVRMKLKIEIGDENPREEDIKKAIADISLLLPMTDREKEYIEKILQSSYKVRMDLGDKVINQATYHPWLASSKAKINFYYWNRYCKYLELEQGWTSDVIESLDSVSDDILDLCGNPNEDGNWKRKGIKTDK